MAFSHPRLVEGHPCSTMMGIASTLELCWWMKWRSSSSVYLPPGAGTVIIWRAKSTLSRDCTAGQSYFSAEYFAIDTTSKLGGPSTQGGWSRRSSDGRKEEALIVASSVVEWLNSAVYDRASYRVSMLSMLVGMAAG